jgi:mono/diheme cytochrome c family protein
VTIPKLGRLRRLFPFSGTILAFLAVLGLAAPAQAADAGNGHTLYDKHCALCHGKQGAPTWPGAPDFRRAASLMKPDAQLLSAIRYGRGAMPAYLGVLKDKELLDVTAHLRTLSR